MEEEVRAEVRARRARSIQVLARWLEEQERAKAEEGTPRESSGEFVGEPVLVGGVVPLEEIVAPGQRLMSEFLLRV